MEILKSLFEKITCKHKWQLLAKTEYIDGCRTLFVCEKCGKMKKKWKVEYYLYNLTERIERRFLTLLGAYAYALYSAKGLGFRTYVKEI